MATANGTKEYFEKIIGADLSTLNMCIVTQITNKMIVRTIDQITGTDREVQGNGFISQRLILEKDGMGFSFHQTIIPKGDEHNWHYKNHLESCYCIEGFGILKNLDTNNSYEIKPGTIYILDKNDNHTFQALEDVVLISVFNPPIKGNEIHKQDGSYDL